MHLKVVLDATPEHMNERTLRHVNQRLLVIIYAIQSGERICNATHLKNDGKVPLRV